ncbi:MAG: WhiB family transcriptional regulator [Actinomycetota bacterium]
MKEVTFYLEPTSCADSDWRHDAACQDIPDPDIFFPIGSTGPALEQVEAAKRICRTCPVRAQCLTWALDTNQETGVWGGLSEEERRELVRAMRREPSLV